MDGKVFGKRASIERKWARAALGEQSRILEAFFTYSVTPFAFLDRDFNFIRVNEAYARADDREPSEFPGRNHFDLYPSDAKAIFEHVVAAKEPYRAVARPFTYADHPERGVTYWDWTLAPVLDDHGEVDFLVLSLNDVTEAKRAEQGLRESEEKYRALMKHAGNAILLTDVEGRLLEANDKAEALLGCAKGELLGMPLGSIHPPQETGRASAAFEQAVRTGSASLSDGLVLRKDGTTVPVDVTVSVVEFGGRRVVQGIFRDISERKRREARLQRYQARLRSLASELSLAEERERRRLARDLHDHISQALAVTKMRLEALRESAPDLAEPLEHILPLVGQTLHDTRSLTFDLSPPALYELGLVSALEALASRIAREHGLRVDVEDDRQAKPVDNACRVVLFHAVRELLFNVVKHAQARRVQVSIAKEAETIRIRVEDDGVGFGGEAVDSFAAGTIGFGLFSIRERLTHLGGALAVESTPGQGTRVDLTAPLGDPSQETKGGLP